MRLQEVYFICKKANDNWMDIEAISKKNVDGGVYVQITNWGSINRVLETLRPIGSLSGKINRIQSFYYLYPGEVVAAVTSADFSLIKNEYTALERQIITICDMCEFLNVHKAESGFDVKLPANISLDELSKCTRDLNNILSTCPVLTSTDSRVDFSAVDIGSAWLSFVVVGGGALAFLTALAALVDKAIMIRSHAITLKQQGEVARSMNISNELLEAQVRVHCEILDKLVESAAEELNEKSGVKGNEEKGQTKHSLKTLCEWMEKGMEIYSAIQAPPEVKAAFPPVGEQQLPESTIKMLTESSEDG